MSDWPVVIASNPKTPTNFLSAANKKPNTELLAVMIITRITAGTSIGPNSRCRAAGTFCKPMLMMETSICSTGPANESNVLWK